MTLLDRHILTRFLLNFAMLFAIMFVFAAAIDVVLALDDFVEAADRLGSEDAGYGARVWLLIRLALDFQAPRTFQFYGFLHGMVAIGAMGFTLSRMYKHRELVAMLAAGISMQRVAMPFVVGMFVLGLVQLVNQELFLPRVAPLLIRGHGEIGQRTIQAFPVDFTRDDRGALLQAARFDPDARTLTGVTILERDERGRTRQRTTADSATWGRIETADGDVPGWVLEGGAGVELDIGSAADPATGALAVEPDSARMAREDASFFATNLSPEVLVLRRHGEYASMLSLQQIGEILENPGAIDREALIQALSRYRWSRFSSVIVNVLLMWLALPAFLIRGPANLMLRALVCAGATLPAVILAAIFTLVTISGIPPAVSVFLPALVLTPVVIAQWLRVET
jgi:lipopolysaccharide export LptBFGC system permease protein LptF